MRIKSEQINKSFEFVKVDEKEEKDVEFTF